MPGKKIAEAKIGLKPKGIWGNPVFKEWFDSRPQNIQRMIRRFPPDKHYRIPGTDAPGSIFSYDENPGGGVSMTIDVESPELQKMVSGVDPRSLKPWKNAPKNDVDKSSRK